MKCEEGYYASSVRIDCGNRAISWKSVNMEGDWRRLPKAEFAWLSISYLSPVFNTSAQILMISNRFLTKSGGQRGQRAVEAAPLARVAGRTGGDDPHQQGVSVAVVANLDHSLGVAAGSALVP
jgi:hypothetical protein